MLGWSSIGSNHFGGIWHESKIFKVIIFSAKKVQDARWWIGQGVRSWGGNQIFWKIQQIHFSSSERYDVGIRRRYTDQKVSIQLVLNIFLESCDQTFLTRSFVSLFKETTEHFKGLSVFFAALIIHIMIIIIVILMETVNFEFGSCSMIKWSKLSAEDFNKIERETAKSICWLRM